MNRPSRFAFELPGIVGFTLLMQHITLP